MAHDPAEPAPGPAPKPAPHVRGGRATLAEVMALVAGLAVGLWLIATDKAPPPPGAMGENLRMRTLRWTGFVLGGVSLVGVPMLLLERRGRRRHGRRAGPGPPWGPGRLLWFSSGASAWLLWPPVVVNRVSGHRGGEASSEVCFAYGTPLMALYVTLALLAGGWLGKRRRKRMARSWRETFGLVLGLLWACTGLYALEILYETDLFN